MTIPPPPDANAHYREIILRHFGRNRICSTNPDAAFFYGFTDEQLAYASSVATIILAQLSRPFGVVQCTGKTHRQVCVEAAKALGAALPESATMYDAWNALEDILLNSAQTLVIERLSGSKGPSKPGFARGLIKVLDDAHFRGFKVMSDLIFIDRASFLEKSWPEIGTYLRLITPFDVANAWVDNLAGTTLVPV